MEIKRDGFTLLNSFLLPLNVLPLHAFAKKEQCSLNYIKVLSLNGRGKTKYHLNPTSSLYHDFKLFNPHIIALSETYTPDDTHLPLKGFTHFKINGVNNGGGIIIYIAESIREAFDVSCHETLYLVTLKSKVDKAILYLAYFPPKFKNHTKIFKDFLVELQNYDKMNYKVVVAGDLNAQHSEFKRPSKLDDYWKG